MTTHAQARDFARSVITARYGRADDGEVRALAGVACLETSYGDGWRGAGKGSHNMGAIQCGKGWGGARFSYVDTHPNADGSSTRYQVDFRAYPTPLEGWADLQRVVFEVCNRKIVRAAARDCDWYGVSRALYQTRYYEGFGPTAEARVANHHKALARAIAVADGVTEPIVVVASGAPETVRRGSRGAAVRELQSRLGLASDGMFGPVTEAAVKSLQVFAGLSVDGVVGPATWAVILGGTP